MSDQRLISAQSEVATPSQEEDAPNVRKAIAIALGTLAVFSLGIVYVLLVLHYTGTSPKRIGGSVPPEIGRSEIGIVDQPVFENDQRLKRLVAEKRGLLNGYGWTDRDAGTIHMPVDRAIEEMVREQRLR
jgi:hypothetical protein